MVFQTVKDFDFILQPAEKRTRDEFCVGHPTLTIELSNSASRTYIRRSFLYLLLYNEYLVTVQANDLFPTQMFLDDSLCPRNVRRVYFFRSFDFLQRRPTRNHFGQRWSTRFRVSFHFQLVVVLTNGRSSIIFRARSTPIRGVVTRRLKPRQRVKTDGRQTRTLYLIVWIRLNLWC